MQRDKEEWDRCREAQAEQGAVWGKPRGRGRELGSLWGRKPRAMKGEGESAI